MSDTNMSTEYTVIFSRPETLDESWANTLRDTENAGPAQLREITDLCSAAGVSADLFDTDNRKRGTVDNKGNYALS